MISQRTIAGLQAAKARGRKLGNPALAAKNAADAAERERYSDQSSRSWPTCRHAPSPPS